MTINPWPLFATGNFLPYPKKKKKYPNPLPSIYDIPGEHNDSCITEKYGLHGGHPMNTY